MKRFLSMLVAIVMVISMVPAAFAAGEVGGTPDVGLWDVEEISSINLTANLAEGDANGNYYLWTANEDGKMIVASSAAAGYAYNIVMTLGETVVSGTALELDVVKGDEVLIQVVATGEGYPAGSVTVTGEYYVEEPEVPDNGIVIITQPADCYFIVGGNATFTVEATNVAKYTWQYRKTADAAWANVGNTTNTYSFKVNYETYEGRQYRCVLTDAEGNQVFTEIATLYNKPANITITYGANDPVVESKVATYVALGDNAVSYQWFSSSNGGSSWTALKDTASAGISGTTTGRLYMPAWTKNEGMLLRCKMYDAEGAFVYSNNFVVKVAENPLVNSGNPVDQWAVAGKNVSFTFEVTGWTGEGAVQYRWQTSRDGVNFGTTTLPTFDQATFTLAAYSSRANVWVRCVAIAPDGNKIISEPAQIKIIPNPLSWAVDAQNVTVAAGTTAEFHVVLQGFEGTADQVSYRWQYQRTVGGAWETLGTNLWNSGTDTLKVPAQARYNGYRFRCIATDYTGQQLYSEKVLLTVN